ncbi:protein of unknown function DUF201 [Methanothermus fervidus DSM 2088]|uniref:ATP-grasp domain-containing protein n=1 Tax=Methanothermus fervidus (strain ATCC 43054 / DSM 2088 / JCM 10308 / V24 S) TaxID=523846 RepID=E3GZJ6_METFV|nr:ATP-grasp domain-containing protein [Methanothermus fervidus]ADP77728.1 protein of unknown function DUF201 [Methanothermus fervidus DSM 2088]
MKLLIVGINTRPIAHAAYNLGHEVYSVSYYCPIDFKAYKDRKCILKYKPFKSCGKLSERFKERYLEEMSKEWIDKVDYIIPYTGAPVNSYPQRKILGNNKIEKIENKYKLYKILRKHFNVPKTYLLSDIDEAKEIINNHPNKKFLIKPVKGSGGYGIFHANNFSNNFGNKKFLLQEYIDGVDVSASVISNGKEAKTIFTSNQLLNLNVAGWEGHFIYEGNIVPSIYENEKMKNIAENVIKKLSLVGSNGVDMVMTHDKIYVIEVNPRLQGTFECAELLGINVLDAHIKACKEGILIDRMNINEIAIKKIIYAKNKLFVKNTDFPKNVHDIPAKNVIIEKGEPVVTILSKAKKLKTAVNKLNKTKEIINKNLK